MMLNLISALIILVGVCASLDSRRIVRIYFDFGEENVAVLGLKIIGVFMIFIGAIILIVNQ